MALEDLKIKEYGSLIANLPDTPSTGGFDAKRLKDYFDGNDKETKEAINNVIDFLINLTGNEEIKGFKVEGNKFFYTTDGETYIETGYTTSEVDNLLVTKANEADVLTKTNANVYTPTGDYQPATKKYVDDKIASTGAADMTQAVYDPTGRQTDIFAEMEKYLPLTGGTLTGNTILLTNGKGRISTDNSNYMQIATFNVAGDRTNWRSFILGNSLFQVDKKNAITFYETVNGSQKAYAIFGEHNKDLIAESFLPTAGGTLTGDIAIQKESAPRIRLKTETGETSIYRNADSTKNYGLTIGDSATAGGIAQLNMNAANPTNTALRLTLTPAGGTAKTYAIFGEHNKPTGTYTGGGSTKTVSVGGVGNMLLLYGNEMLALVTPTGAICKMYDSNTLYGLGASYLGFSGGKLTISGTANANFNASGVTYNYQVL